MNLFEGRNVPIKDTTQLKQMELDFMDEEELHEGNDEEALNYVKMVHDMATIY